MVWGTTSGQRAPSPFTFTLEYAATGDQFNTLQLYSLSGGTKVGIDISPGRVQFSPASGTCPGGPPPPWPPPSPPPLPTAYTTAMIIDTSVDNSYAPYCQLVFYGMSVGMSVTSLSTNIGVITTNASVEWVGPWQGSNPAIRNKATPAPTRNNGPIEFTLPSTVPIIAMSFKGITTATNMEVILKMYANSPTGAPRTGTPYCINTLGWAAPGLPAAAGRLLSTVAQNRTTCWRLAGREHPWPSS
jgi:hypothetical protein